MTRSTSDNVTKKITRTRPQLSCNQCRASRRKCDREEPCGRCKQLNIQCTHDASRLALNARIDPAAQQVHNATAIPQSSAFHRTPSSTVESSSHQWHDQASSSTVPSASTPLSTPSQRPPTTYSSNERSGTSANKATSLNSLLCHRSFLSHCLEVYFSFHDSSTHLLEDTRIHRLSRNRHNTNLIDESTGDFDPIRVLSLAIICIVAQMEPTNIQSALLLLPSPLRRLWPMAVDVEVAAYESAKQLLDHPCITPPEWTAEHFAASMLLKLYEKQAGWLNKCSEGVLVNAARIQWAGLHRWPRTTKSSSFIDIEKGYSSEEDRLLSYRIFWEAYDKERISSWTNGWGYSIRPEQSNMCLRDPFGHATIRQLSRPDAKDPLEYDENPCCSCLQVGAPTLSTFAGAHARIGAFCGRLYDRMGKIRDGRAPMKEEVEAFARSAANSLSLLETKVVKGSESRHHLLSRSQADAIVLIIAQLRCGIAKRIVEVYAAQYGDAVQSKEKATGLIKRRELDAAMALIEQAAQMTTKADSASINRIIMPSFVFQQIISLFDNLTSWFRFDPRKGRLLEGESDESRSYLLLCLRKALLGRNLLILLARKSDLRHVQELLHRIMSRIKDFFDRILPQEMLLQCCDPNDLIDEALIIEELESNSPSMMVPARDFPLDHSQLSLQTTREGVQDDSEHLMTWDSIFPDPTPLLFSDEEMATFFADLPELEHLLQPVY